MSDLARLSINALRRPLMLSMLLCLPLFAPSSAALSRTQTQSESGSMARDDAGSLAVSVSVWSVGGAAPAPGTPPKPTPTAEALPNVMVRVRQADGTDLEQVTDEQGQTTFDLDAGEYLVYLPVDAQPQPALQYASSVRAIPDGTLTRDWATAEVDAAQRSRVALQIVLQLP